jgi:hypothetical protein
MSESWRSFPATTVTCVVTLYIPNYTLRGNVRPLGLSCVWIRFSIDLPYLVIDSSSKCHMYVVKIMLLLVIEDSIMFS